VAIGQAVAEIWRIFPDFSKNGDFSIFQNGVRRHLGVSTFQNVNGRNSQEGQTASSHKISGRSVNRLLRYGDFSILKNVDCRHLGFLNFRNYNDRSGQRGQLTASPRQFSWRSVKPLLRYDDFSIFPRWRLSAILDL